MLDWLERELDAGQHNEVVTFSSDDPVATTPASGPIPPAVLPAQRAGDPPHGEHRTLRAVAQEISHLTEQVAKLDQAIAGVGHRAIHAAEGHLPGWARPKEGEVRWPAALTVLAAIGLQLVIPERLVVPPRWLLPAIEFALLALLVAVDPWRIRHDRHPRDHRLIRTVSLTLVAVASLANMWSAVRLIQGLVHGTEGQEAGALLAVGAAIWATNVIVFALWYWEFDRGGPVARANGRHRHPDFQFTQMQTPALAHDEWEPIFVDYLYLSFTNAAAFSPTDTLPLSRWAKMAMLTQSCVSLATVILVIARAVNIFQ